jgi:uncharacterized protein
MSHKSLFLTLLLAASAVFAPAPVAAQGADDARIDRLLEVTRARQLIDSMLPQVEASQQQMFEQIAAGRRVDADQQATMERIRERSAAALRQVLAWENLEPIYRDLYRETFSAEDVDAMLAFYESPTGQRVLDKMPLLMEKTMVAMQRIVVPLLQQLEQDIRAETSAAD